MEIRNKNYNVRVLHRFSSTFGEEEIVRKKKTEKIKNTKLYNKILNKRYMCGKKSADIFYRLCKSKEALNKIRKKSFFEWKKIEIAINCITLK